MEVAYHICMIRIIFITVFITSAGPLWTQEYIRNGSFEGFVPQLNNVPRSWNICRTHSSPDIQPVTSQKTPSDGRTYIGLAKRGQSPSNSNLAYTAESIGQEIDPLIPGFEYLITVHLSYDPNHQSSEGEKEAPGKLNVYIGDGICFDTVRIWQSPIIDHEDWKIYERNYIASCFNNYIILEADHGDVLAREAAYLLADQVSLIPVNNESAVDTIVCNDQIEDMQDTVVESETGPCFIYIPNAITANQDRLNDDFQIYFECDIIEFQIQIYNRWGNRVFQSADPEFLWSPANPYSGPYIYQLRTMYRDGNGAKRNEVRSNVIYNLP